MSLGAQHCPLGLHALWGLCAAGVVGGRPRGGWPATVVRGVWCQALLLPWTPVLWSGQPGFCDPCVPGAVGAGVGTQHRPHSVRPSGPALLAVGVAEGRPRGGAFHHCEGRLRSGAVPPPTACPVGGLLGSANHVLWARVCGCGAPTLSPGLHALWRLRAAGVVGGRPRGGWPATVVRGVWCQALSLPQPPVLWNGQPGFRDHVLWARVSVCAVCVVSVRCVSWCAVPLFSCPSGAPLSGASVRCCAHRVPVVPPSLRASLARLLATPCFLRGFVALYPFLYPSPWHALFPCLRSGACLGLFPCRLVVLSRWVL